MSEMHKVSPLMDKKSWVGWCGSFMILWGPGSVSPCALPFPTFGFHPQCFKMPAAAPAIMSTFQAAGSNKRVKQKGLSLVVFSPFQRTFPEFLL